MTRLAPCDAACLATSKPIPDEPPSTTTRLSCKPFPRSIEFSLCTLFTYTVRDDSPTTCGSCIIVMATMRLEKLGQLRLEPPDTLCRDCGGEKALLRHLGWPVPGSYFSSEKTATPIIATGMVICRALSGMPSSSNVPNPEPMIVRTSEGSSRLRLDRKS